MLGVLGMTPPQSKASPQPLGAASHVPPIEPGLAAFPSPPTPDAELRVQTTVPSMPGSGGVILASTERVEGREP